MSWSNAFSSTRSALGVRGPGLRVGVVGCGATAQRNHLPALHRMGIQPRIVVDSDLMRAKAVAARFGAEHFTSDLAQAPEQINCAIVATPPPSHASIACALLAEGIHVLVEKPLATSPEESRQISAAARMAGRVVAVGLTRRYWHATRWLAAFLASGDHAEVEFFDFREGFAFGWPAESDYFIRRESSGGGTLLDTGSHVLDLVLLWFGDVARIAYYDDSYGGLEADCEMHLRMKSGASGFIELSRTRVLRNSVLVYGRGWLIEVPDVLANELRGHPPAVLREEFGGIRGDRLPSQSLADLYVLQLEDFFRAVVTGSHPAATAATGTAGVELISDCYSGRHPLDLSWVTFDTRRSRA